MSSSVKITLYAKPEVKERLQELADADRRSISEFCLLTLERAFGAGAVGGVEGSRAESGAQADVVPGATSDGGRSEAENGTTGQAVGLTAAPAPNARKPRTVTCEHRLAPDQFCKECDA